MLDTTTRPISAVEQTEDSQLDTNLRPKTLDDYVGQSRIKENLSILIEAAKQRGEPLDHVLLYGPPGLGKTTLAHIISHEMGSAIQVTSGPAIERTGDLAAILTNMPDGGVLFIDEIHRLSRTVEEMLYPAMEDYAIDIIIGKGPGAKTVRLDLPKITIIGATTKLSSLSSPLRDRFGITYHFNFYTLDDIKQIVNRSAKLLSIPIDDVASTEIASRSRFTPRIANRLLKRVRDYAQVRGNGIIDVSCAKMALEMLDVDAHGLDATDRRILQIIIEKYQGGPVGVGTIAAATSEEVQTIEDVYEPFLLQKGFLHRTSRGRVATQSAYEHLGIEYDKEQQALFTS